MLSVVTSASAVCVSAGIARRSTAIIHDSRISSLWRRLFSTWYFSLARAVVCPPRGELWGVHRSLHPCGRRGHAGCRECVLWMTFRKPRTAGICYHSILRTLILQGHLYVSVGASYRVSMACATTQSTSMYTLTTCMLRNVMTWRHQWCHRLPGGIVVWHVNVCPLGQAILLQSAVVHAKFSDRWGALLTMEQSPHAEAHFAWSSCYSSLATPVYGNMLLCGWSPRPVSSWNYRIQM